MLGMYVFLIPFNLMHLNEFHVKKSKINTLSLFDHKTEKSCRERKRGSNQVQVWVPSKVGVRVEGNHLTMLTCNFPGKHPAEQIFSEKLLTLKQTF